MPDIKECKSGSVEKKDMKEYKYFLSGNLKRIDVTSDNTEVFGRIAGDQNPLIIFATPGPLVDPAPTRN